MDRVVFYSPSLQYSRQDNLDISYEREQEEDPLQIIEEQILDVNLAIHFVVKEEFPDSQESLQPDTDTHVAQIKEETLDKYPDYESCHCGSVNCNAGINNFECHLDATNMGIAKSRRNSHHAMDIVETKLEYIPAFVSNTFKRSLSPHIVDENEERYSFSPAKHFHVEDKFQESSEDKLNSVRMTDVWESSIGGLLTPIKSKAGSVAGSSAAKNLSAGKKLNLSAGKKLNLSVGKKLNLSAGKQLKSSAGKKLNLSAGKQLKSSAGKKLNLSAGKKLNLSAGKKLNLLAGKQLKLSAGKKLNLSAGKKLNLSAGKKLKSSAGKKLNLSAGKKLNLLAGKKLKLSAGEKLNLSADKKLNLSADQKLNLSEDKKLNLSAGKIPNLSAGKKLNLSAAKKLNLSAGKKLNFSAAKKLNLSAGKKLSLSAGKKLNLSAAKKLNLSAAKKLNFSAGKKLNLSTDKKLNLSAGKNLNLSAGKTATNSGGRQSRQSVDKSRVSQLDGKTASNKVRGRPSQGKLASKNKDRLSEGKSMPEEKVVSDNVRSRKSVSKVLLRNVTKAKVKTYSVKAGYKRKVPIGKLRCRKCPFSTNRPKILAEHEPVHGHELICRWCGVEYPSLQALSRHSLVHEKSKTFACSRCNFACRYLWKLHSHRNIAHPEVTHPGTSYPGRTYHCQACQYTCPKTSMLKRHMLIHLQFRPHSCKLCPFTCNIKYNLKLHMLRHTREKPYLCKVCGMRFSRSYTLTSHSRVHTGEKPYACDNCNFTCAHFSSLKRHKLLHVTQNERLHCLTCDFACKLLVTFLKHRATEHNERGLYTCNLCHAGVDNTRQLAKHLWEHKKEGKYGDDEERFRLPKYLVRIRNKKAAKLNRARLEAIEKEAHSPRSGLKDANNTSIGKLIDSNKAVKNVGRPAKISEIIRKSSPIVKSVGKVPIEHNKVPDFSKVPTSFLQAKVVCRRLTISEIIRRRVDSKP